MERVSRVGIVLLLPAVTVPLVLVIADTDTLNVEV